MEKLIKYVARVSAHSRRKSEELIKSGKVKINKIVVTEPSTVVDEHDSVSILNEIIHQETARLYIALNKPDGYMSDLKDPRGRKLARDLIKVDLKLFPVGRLDYHSEGLIIFTNDGDFANMIMHPKYEVEKEYFVKIKGSLTRDEIQRMKEGIQINGEVYKIEGIRYIRKAVKQSSRSVRPLAKQGRGVPETQNAWYSITINEGKNRMIRKIADAMKHPVLKLKRIRIGRLDLGDLQTGKYRYIEKNEVFGKTKQKIKGSF